MKYQKINHLAVWLCVVLSQVLSFCWYSPVLFAGKWMGYLGKTMEDFNGESPIGLLFAIPGSIIATYFLAWLFIRLKIDTAAKGSFVAFACVFCFFFFPTFTQDSFSLRPVGLSLINTGSMILNFCVTGLVLGGWSKLNIEQGTRNIEL